MNILDGGIVREVEINGPGRRVDERDPGNEDMARLRAVERHYLLGPREELPGNLATADDGMILGTERTAMSTLLLSKMWGSSEMSCTRMPEMSVPTSSGLTS